MPSLSVDPCCVQWSYQKWVGAPPKALRTVRDVCRDAMQRWDHWCQVKRTGLVWSVNPISPTISRRSQGRIFLGVLYPIKGRQAWMMQDARKQKSRILFRIPRKYPQYFTILVKAVYPNTWGKRAWLHRLHLKYEYIQNRVRSIAGCVQTSRALVTPSWLTYWYR